MQKPQFDDSTLPDGWTREVSQRKNGKTAGTWDIYLLRYSKLRYSYVIILIRHESYICLSKSLRKKIPAWYQLEKLFEGNELFDSL